jgi:pentatricopeptide repeat domain-containing protein 1
MGNLQFCNKRAKVGKSGESLISGSDKKRWMTEAVDKVRNSGSFENKRKDGNDGDAKSESVEVLKAYTKLMSSCAKGGQWERSLNLMREMRSKGIEPDVVCFSAAINACAKARQIKEALVLFREMRVHGLRPDLISYNALIGACSKCGFYKGAIAAIEEMRKDGMQPDVITYNAAISACANAGYPDMATKFLEDMQTDGLEPDVITYSAVIDACSKGKKGERALEVFDDMKLRGLQPNVITYNTAIGACSRARLPLRAMELLAEMEQQGLSPTHVSYTTAIICLAKSGKFDAAIELLHVMRAKPFQVPQYVKAYDAVIAVCMEKANVDGAHQLLRELQKEGWIDDLSKYGSVIRACARRGNYEGFNDKDEKVKFVNAAAGLGQAQQPIRASLGPDLPDALKWRKWSNVGPNVLKSIDSSDYITCSS